MLFPASSMSLRKSTRQRTVNRRLLNDFVSLMLKVIIRMHQKMKVVRLPLQIHYCCENNFIIEGHLEVPPDV